MNQCNFYFVSFLHISRYFGLTTTEDIWSGEKKKKLKRKRRTRRAKESRQMCECDGRQLSYIHENQCRYNNSKKQIFTSLSISNSHMSPCTNHFPLISPYKYPLTSLFIFKPHQSHHSSPPITLFI